ncbi:hypothetical protein ACHHYP_04063 [Achlya hypogyna]|uniref:Uncharacterized protein n=1 Tax=Achlya hypogyna TaxID=1202772 RepID=A0A1V9Z2B0_ACHHY|nr:hypothetical protein ACHHYP_04063 [Achlya hypogyna]
MRSSYENIKRKRLRVHQAAPSSSRVLLDAGLMGIISAYQNGIFLCLQPYVKGHKTIPGADAFHGDEVMILLYVSNRRARMWLNVMAEHSIDLVKRLLLCKDLTAPLRLGGHSNDEKSRELMDIAAECGDLPIVTYLHEQQLACTSFAMDRAAANGHTAVLAFLHEVHGAVPSDNVLYGIVSSMSGCTCTAEHNAERYACLRYLVEKGIVSNAMHIRHGDEIMLTLVHLQRLDTLQLFHTHGLDRLFRPSTMDTAANRGCLSIVRFLHEHRSEGCTPAAMDLAAGQGYLDVVRYLHEHRTEGCTARAITSATVGGHREIVEYLVANRPERWSHPDTVELLAEQGGISMLRFVFAHDERAAVTKEAMSLAVSHGHLDVVIFFHERAPEVDCRRLAVVNALENGFVDVVTFMVTHRPEGLTTRLLGAVVRRGHLTLLQLLVAQRPSLVSTTTLWLALDAGHKGVAKYLFSTFPVLATARLLNAVVRNNDMELLKLMVRQSPGTVSPAAMHVAAKHGHLGALRYLHAHGGGCSHRALDLAAEHGHLRVVKFLHEERTEGASTYAMDKAAEYGHLSIVKYLHSTRAEGCTSHALSLAVQNNHAKVVAFLLTHRNEGCVLHAMTQACQRHLLPIANLLRSRPIGSCLCTANDYRMLPILEQNEWFQERDVGRDPWFSSEDGSDDDGDSDYDSDGSDDYRFDHFHHMLDWFM